MSGRRELTYAVNFGTRSEGLPGSNHNVETGGKPFAAPIPRLARLLALAIRLEGQVRERTVRDYAAVARRGRVTRARMTQIMKLSNLAPDIQEHILFLPSAADLNERNLRPICQVVTTAVGPKSTAMTSTQSLPEMFP